MITDDNQLLAYGFGVERDLFEYHTSADLNNDTVLECAGSTP